MAPLGTLSTINRLVGGVVTFPPLATKLKKNSICTLKKYIHRKSGMMLKLASDWTAPHQVGSGRLAASPHTHCHSDVAADTAEAPR